jgi:hypothetical protein
MPLKAITRTILYSLASSASYQLYCTQRRHYLLLCSQSPRLDDKCAAGAPAWWRVLVVGVERDGGSSLQIENASKRSITTLFVLELITLNGFEYSFIIRSISFTVLGGKT